MADEGSVNKAAKKPKGFITLEELKETFTKTTADKLTSLARVIELQRAENLKNGTENSGKHLDILQTAIEEAQRRQKDKKEAIEETGQMA